MPSTTTKGSTVERNPPKKGMLAIASMASQTPQKASTQISLMALAAASSAITASRS